MFLPLDGSSLSPRFDQLLAPYAQKHGTSLGRANQEKPDPDRLPFQRDRDRIIHCSSFRRLRGKRQVVSPSLGDHYRNRLSHTLEVVQIARDIARTLGLNEDLCEAIALSHDLGHPPFGHDGEKILDQKMKEHGLSFEHNLQSLRIVTHLEHRYPDFEGLNLTYEVREGLQKHGKDFLRPDGQTVIHPSLEAQLVDLCDEMAYLSADMEDALRGDFLSWEQIQKAPLCDFLLQEKTAPKRSQFNRDLIHLLIQRLSQDAFDALQKNHIQDPLKAQQHPTRLITFASDFEKSFLDLKAYLFKHFYLIPSVQKSSLEGQTIIAQLFDILLQSPEKLPSPFQENKNPPQGICDYIAGMTDEYATRKHKDLLK